LTYLDIYLFTVQLVQRPYTTQDSTNLLLMLNN